LEDVGKDIRILLKRILGK